MMYRSETIPTRGPFSSFQIEWREKVVMEIHFASFDAFSCSAVVHIFMSLLDYNVKVSSHRPNLDISKGKTQSLQF
jgi:hypothetical protein